MAADASFNTEILSISAGLILARPPARSGIPSITMSAEELLKVFVPRTRMAGLSAPGAPLPVSMKRPATLPAKAVPKLERTTFQVRHLLLLQQNL